MLYYIQYIVQIQNLTMGFLEQQVTFICVLHAY